MSSSLSLWRNQVTAEGDAEREGQVRAAGWEIMDDGYARTIGSRRGFSFPPLIGKIIDQSQAGVCEAGVAGEASSGHRVNLNDDGFPGSPRLSPNP